MSLGKGDVFNSFAFDGFQVCLRRKRTIVSDLARGPLVEFDLTVDHGFGES